MRRATCPHQSKQAASRVAIGNTIRAPWEAVRTVFGAWQGWREGHGEQLNFRYGADGVLPNQSHPLHVCPGRSHEGGHAQQCKSCACTHVSTHLSASREGWVLRGLRPSQRAISTASIPPRCAEPTAQPRMSMLAITHTMNAAPSAALADPVSDRGRRYPAASHIRPDSAWSTLREG